MRILLCSFILISVVAKSQTTDTVAIYDRVAPHSLYKEYSYPNNLNESNQFFGGSTRNTSNPIGIFKYNAAQNEFANFREVNNSTLVIIDNKIFSTEDFEYLNLDPTKIKDLKVIKDQKSKTGIKAIIFIQMK